MNMTDNATEQAASALAFLSTLNDFNDKIDDTRKFLEMVQAEASIEEYDGFVGCLKEFAEEIVFPITRLKRDFVTSCALLYLQDHHELILRLSDYIPEILDEQPDSKGQESATANRQQVLQTGDMEWQQPSTQSSPAKHQRLLPLEWLLSLQDKEKKFQKQKEQEKKSQQQEEMRFFMLEVREQILPSNPATYTQIETLMQQFFVENMSAEKAMKMSPLIQHHKGLWKEFQADEASSTVEDKTHPGLDLLSTEANDLLALQKSMVKEFEKKIGGKLKSVSEHRVSVCTVYDLDKACMP